MSDCNEILALYLRYYHDTGTEQGLYLRDVPFAELTREHHDQITRNATFAATTGLVPRQKYWRGEWRWVFEEK